MKQLTVKELIEKLTDLSVGVSLDTIVYAEDMIGDEYEIKAVYIDDYNHIIIGY